MDLLPLTESPAKYRTSSLLQSLFKSQLMMSAPPQIFEEYTSSELSDLDSPSPPSGFFINSPMKQAPSTVEDAPTVTHHMVTRHKNRVKLIQRQSARTSSRRRGYHECSSGDDSPNVTRSIVCRPRQCSKLAHKKKSRAIKRPKKYEVSSPCGSSGLGSPPVQTGYFSDEQCQLQPTSTEDDHLATSFTQDASPSGGEDPILARRIMTEIEYNSQPAQGHSPQRNEASWGVEESIDNQAEISASSLPQFYDAGLSDSIPTQYFARQNGFLPEEHFAPDQQLPVISHFDNIDSILMELAGIDPAFLNPSLLGMNSTDADTFVKNFSLPTGPILLNVGKPIYIPVSGVKHFLPLSTFHDEPSGLALSDYDKEEGIDFLTTPGITTGREHYDFTKSYKSTMKSSQNYFQNEHRLPVQSSCSVRDRKRVRRGASIQVRSRKQGHCALKERKPIKDQKTTDEQTRFILLVRTYWGLTLGKTVRAFNREFKKSCSITAIRNILEAALYEPKFYEYRRVLGSSKYGTQELEGLDDRLLAEANGFLDRLEE